MIVYIFKKKMPILYCLSQLKAILMELPITFIFSLLLLSGCNPEVNYKHPILINENQVIGQTNAQLWDIISNISTGNNNFQIIAYKNNKKKKTLFFTNEKQELPNDFKDSDKWDWILYHLYTFYFDENGIVYSLKVKELR